MVRYREDLTRLVDTVLSGPGKTTSELRRAVEARAGALSGVVSLRLGKRG